MAVPSTPSIVFVGGSKKKGESQFVRVYSGSDSDSMTCIVSQTQGGVALWQDTLTAPTESDPSTGSRWWVFTYSTDSITSTPYYVRVYGTNASGNSATVSKQMTLFMPPAITITYPTDGATLTSSAVTIAWTATDDYGISYQRVSVSHDGTELWGAEVEGNSIAIPSSVVFENGESYSFSVMARNGKGMEATATNTASFHFDVPSSPELSISEGGGKSASIQVVDTHYSESGSTISVDGSAIADSFTVFGASVQDGTPTPSAPVAIESVESQNLQPFFSKDFSDTSYWFYPPFTAGGVSTDTTPTATQLSDGWAHVEWSGTVSRRQLTATTPAMPTDGSIKPSTSYTLMVEVRNFSATGTNVKIIFPATDGTKAPWTTNSYQGVLSDGTFLYTAATKADISAATQLRCFMVACDGVSTSTTFALSFDIRISLYEGTYTGNYMPCGSVNIGTHGRNLFASPTALMRNGVMRTDLLTVSGGTITNDAANGNHGTYCYYPAFILPNDGSITVSADVYLTGTHATSNVFMAILDGSATPASDVAPSYTVGISKNVWTHVEHTFTVSAGHSAGEKAMLALMAANTGNTLQLKNVMLEAGSTATPYQPYDGTAYPIDLQGNSLRSLPDGTRDELRVGERKVLVKNVAHVEINDQSASISANAVTVGGTPMTLFRISMNANSYPAFYYTAASDEYNVLSNQYYSNGSLTRFDGWICMNHAINTQLTIPGAIDVVTTLWSTVSDFKAALATNPLYVDYRLATPQEIDLGAASDYPFIPEDGEMWVEGTEMDAVLRPADYAGQPEPDSIDVVRVNPDGTSWVVASGLDEGDTVTDPLPPLGVDAVYKAVGRKTDGGTAEKSYSINIPTCSWVMNLGDDAAIFRMVGRNPSENLGYTHGGELYHFARGFQNPEDMLPEFYPVGSIDGSWSFEFDTTTRQDTVNIMALLFRYPTAWFRSPFGERFRAKVSPARKLDRRTKRITVSCDLIRFREAE